ncbi:MAG: DUF6364 family protein [Synechococcales cyanobacterium]
MQTKLTLRLDSRLIQKAKDWAATQDISVSEAVAQFFSQLPDSESKYVSPWVQSLTGILTPAETTDRQAHESYLDYLAEKYH